MKPVPQTDLAAVSRTAALVLTPTLGAASFIVSVIAGQMLASLLIDHFGLMGLASKPIRLWRVVGVMLILVGMLVVQVSSYVIRR